MQKRYQNCFLSNLDMYLLKIYNGLVYGGSLIYFIRLKVHSFIFGLSHKVKYLFLKGVKYFNSPNIPVFGEWVNQENIIMSKLDKNQSIFNKKHMVLVLLSNKDDNINKSKIYFMRNDYVSLQRCFGIAVLHVSIPISLES